MSSIRCKTCSKKSLNFITSDHEIKYVCICGKKIVVEKKENVKLPKIDNEIKKLEELQTKLKKTRVTEFNKLRDLVLGNDKISREFLQKREKLKENITEIDNKLKMIESFSN